jgi:hypothetical protein
MPDSQHATHIIHPLKTIVASFTVLTVVPAPVAAAHDSLPCSPPSSFQPLFDLLHSLTQLAFIGGIALGTLGLLTASLFVLLPGEDSTRRGKQVAKNTVIGTILLLSSNMVMQFLTSELGTTICT